MVEAKQAERDRLRSQEEVSSDDDDEVESHIMPTVIVDSKPRRFTQNSPKNYAKVSNKLVKAKHQVFENEVVEKQEICRQNWRNKEIRSRSEQHTTTPAAPDVNEMENVSFAKTYSFRNLPKGTVFENHRKKSHSILRGSSEARSRVDPELIPS